jgi:hypothetical protein
MQIQKTINPGTMLEYVGSSKKHVPVFCRIEYTASDAEQKENVNGPRAFIKKYEGTGKLSITGVVGPRSNGDCWGSCGQISDTIRQAINAGEFIPNDAQGWTVPDVLSFLDLWDRYHLNDMRPECDHQRAAGWPQMARIELHTYQFTLKSTVRNDKKRLECEAIDRAASTEKKAVGFSPLERKILKLEDFIKLPTATLEGEMARFYEPTSSTGYFKHDTIERAGWVRFEEDPRGLLGKPCPVCGYKYGHAWNTEKLSSNILHTLEALAETKVIPAWI